MSHLEEYFPRDLALLLTRSLAITPQINFSQRSGLYLNPNGKLISINYRHWFSDNKDQAITHVTKMNIRDTRFLYTLNTQATVKLVGVQNYKHSRARTDIQLHDVIDMTDNVFLLHDGTVSRLLDSGVGMEKLDTIKDIVQVQKFIWDFIIYLLAASGDVFMIMPDYTIVKLQLPGPAIKLCDSAIKLLDGSYVKPTSFGRKVTTTPTDIILDRYSVMINANNKLVYNEKYFYNLMAGIISFSRQGYTNQTTPDQLAATIAKLDQVLDFNFENHTLFILNKDGQVMIWGWNPDSLFGLKKLWLKEPTVLNIL